MFSLDEDDEGEVSFGESSDAEREMTPDIPKAPAVKTFDDDGNFEGASDIDSNTLRAFVVAVIYANIAVLFVFLGPMVWYFQGWSRLGPALLVVGLLAGIRTYQTYRSWERSRDDRNELNEQARDEQEESTQTNTASSSDADESESEADVDPIGTTRTDESDTTPPETS